MTSTSSGDVAAVSSSSVSTDMSATGKTKDASQRVQPNQFTHMFAGSVAGVVSKVNIRI
jgi:hypothetical protein